jgi:hypothetical protein
MSSVKLQFTPVSIIVYRFRKLILQSTIDLPNITHQVRGTRIESKGWKSDKKKKKKQRSFGHEINFKGCVSFYSQGLSLNSRCSIKIC